MVATTVVGCHKAEPNKPDHADAAPNAAAAKQSLDGLKPKLSELNANFSDLRKQVEAIPANFPEFGDVRAKFYSSVEALGAMGAKLNWLSDRLDTAVREGKPDALATVSEDIAHTYEELQQAERTRIELVHALSPFSQQAQAAAAPTFKTVLRSGYVLTATDHHIEQHLLEFLEDPKQKVDKTTWFDFDPPFVAGGGLELDKEAFKAQLENVFQILKAYPEAKLEIGGFTDNSGTAAENKTLSVACAQEVKNKLVGLGVAASRLVASGYGSEHPLCPANDTPECKTKNRRISVRLTAK